MKINDLCFGYKGKDLLFNKLSYDFGDSGIYLIQGNNGEGKTTLIKLIIGLLKPVSGEIELKHENISYLPDHNGLYPALTVEENIQFRLGLYNQSFSQKKEKIDNWLQNYQIDIYYKSKVSTLSLGTQKKVALICSCVIEPDILVLDEPTIGLDKESRLELITMINDLQSIVKLILIVSHDSLLMQKLNVKQLKLSNGMIHDA